MVKSFGFWILVFAVLANFILGFWFNFYRFGWFDITLHFLGGFGVYILSANFFRKDLSGLPWIKRSILLIGISVAAGVFWEFAEYTASIVWPARDGGFSFIGDLADTVNDLAMDVIGAFAGSILHFFRQRKP